jgi:hypothetical protein
MGAPTGIYLQDPPVEVKPRASHAQILETCAQLSIFKTWLIQYLIQFKSNPSLSS